MSKLDEIFAFKRTEVEAAKQSVPLSELVVRAKDASSVRPFRKALESAEGVALIAEVKKASPSKGVIRADFDAGEIAAQYERAGAHCLSVLTDARYFQGSQANLEAARLTTQLPILRKDFLYEPYQVWEARAMGADAVLLIVASLSDEQIAELYGLAKELEMDALVEVHDEAEAERALALGCDLIGVNNRNLADFKTDLSTSDRLIPMISPHALAVSESALESFADIERVRRAGAKAVLIGTTFCAAPDIEAKVREVMAW
jgi:indole-3-glycerol phosphate synthase